MSNFCADCRPGTLQALSKSRSQTSTHMRHSRNSGDRSRTNCEWVDSVIDTDRDGGVHPEDVVRLYLRVVFTCQIGAAAAISLELHLMACQLLGRSARPMGSPIIIPAFNVVPTPLHPPLPLPSTLLSSSSIPLPYNCTRTARQCPWSQKPTRMLAMLRRARRSGLSGLSEGSRIYSKPGTWDQYSDIHHAVPTLYSKGEAKSKVTKSPRFGDDRWQVSL